MILVVFILKNLRIVRPRGAHSTGICGMLGFIFEKKELCFWCICVNISEKLSRRGPYSTDICVHLLVEFPKSSCVYVHTHVYAHYARVRAYAYT